MHAASRHGTPSLTSLPKGGGVSCFGRSSEGQPSSFANGTGWTAWPLTSFHKCRLASNKAFFDDVPKTLWFNNATLN